jgi:hypothetical protein
MLKKCDKYCKRKNYNRQNYPILRHFKVTIIKAVWPGQKDGHIDNQKTIESPELEWCTYHITD